MPEALPAVLSLASGLRIDDPFAKALDYCQREYALYDAVPVAKDSTLTVHDMLLSVAVNSRLDAKGLSSFWRDKARVEQHLELLPADLKLADPHAEIPYDLIVRMFEEFEHIPYVKLSVASKVLHKK